MMSDFAHFETGKRNYLALKKILWRMGVFIEHEDVGGTESRSVRLDLQTGQLTVRRGMTPVHILAPAALEVIKGRPENASAYR